MHYLAARCPAMGQSFTLMFCAVAAAAEAAGLDEAPGSPMAWHTHHSLHPSGGGARASPAYVF